MQLLERISFLLRSPAAAAAASPLLLILQAYARAGADTARAVWQCPGMLEALQGLLQRAATLSADVMTVVRLLSSSSAQMLKAVASSGKLAALATHCRSCRGAGGLIPLQPAMPCLLTDASSLVPYVHELYTSRVLATPESWGANAESLSPETNFKNFLRCVLHCLGPGNICEY